MHKKYLLFTLCGLVIIASFIVYENLSGTKLAKAVFEHNLFYTKWAMFTGQSPNQVIEGKTLLTWAFVKLPGGVLVANELLKYGADVNQHGRGGNTALMEAAMWENVDGVKFLLNAGADPNITDDDGTTALIIVSNTIPEGNYLIEITRALIAKGANPCIKNKSGRTAVKNAEKNNNKQTLTLLGNGKQKDICRLKN
jgi:ankyrin repeat protein